MGSTAGTDPAFIDCIMSVVPVGWQTCPKNKWNYKAAQPVGALTCQEGYLPPNHLLQGFPALQATLHEWCLKLHFLILQA